MIESSKVEEKRTVSPKEKEVDKTIQGNILRPKTLGDYVGQETIKKHMSVSMWSAKIRWEVLEHMLFYWPPGLGKTTLSQIIAGEMWTNLRATSGPAIEKQSDLVSILSNIEEGDILFIDEIHRLRPQVEEILYTAMEDKHIEKMVWAWTWAKIVKLALKPFTLVGATTRLSSLSSPLRDRFWNVMKLDFYDENDIWKIIKKNCDILELQLCDITTNIIAKKSRGTPRISNRLLKIVRDYKTIWKDVTDPSTLEEIFKEIWIDSLWLDYLDRKYLDTLYSKFASSAVWLNTLASAIGEEESTLEDVVEPYLLQIGFIERTPRGRKITLAWEKHITK